MNRPIFFSSFFSIQRKGSKFFTSPAILQLNAAGSKCVIGPMPLTPATRFFLLSHAEQLDDNLFYACVYAGHSHSSAIRDRLLCLLNSLHFKTNAKFLAFSHPGQPAHSMHASALGQLWGNLPMGMPKTSSIAITSSSR